jgi:hypothetical protein
MEIARSSIRAAAIAVAALVIACAKPIAPERIAYVGEWKADNMRLVITQEGQVRYARVKGGARTTVDAPLKEFDGDDFIVGVGPMKTRFVVTKPPHREGNVWKMTVDGVELVRGLVASDEKA